MSKSLLMRTLIASLIFVLFLGTQTFAQTVDHRFFDDADRFFQSYVKDGKVDYATLSSQPKMLDALIQSIASTDASASAAAEQQAFYINAYNLLVIQAVTEQYPIASVQDVANFFDKKDKQVGGKQISLNELEKEYLLKVYKDARFHFVLVCGAVDCPPITNFAYRPELLEQQLEQQTAASLNNNSFTRVNNEQVALSQIFNWYKDDFGGKTQDVIAFINSYRTDKISTDAQISYYTYNWQLNQLMMDIMPSTITTTSTKSNNANRYVVSSTIKKGTVELKLFNNLYTQRTTNNEGELSNRSSFFSTTLTALYGVSNRFNAGISTRYRRVRNDNLPSNPLSVFSNSLEAGESNRSGLTAFGPQFRYAPVEKWTNFSIQTTLLFPIGEDLTGNDSEPYIDWGGTSVQVQLFNDFPVGDNFSLFTELDLFWEDLGAESEGHINRFSTPATLIFSYNPTPKSTIYTIGSFSPFWQSEFDYFTQAGVGSKYQFTRNVELELLYTAFSNKFLSDTGGKAATYNIGLRYNL